jgi:sugar lactone lactonase YvrE
MPAPTPLPAPAAAFGGPDLETLYITTAAGPGRSGGELFRLQAGVTGLASHAYQG